MSVFVDTLYTYVATPPQEQDMTQGQFFRQSLRGLYSKYFKTFDSL